MKVRDMKLVLVFDLDDTLYPELTFVESGFRAVAYFLEKNFNLPPKTIYKQLITELKNNGRGKIFDNVLSSNSIFSKNLVRKCLSVYRQHKPEIKLYKDAKTCLKRFENYPIYIVTDGNKMVQKNKISALDIDDKVKKVFITHHYGIKNEKPSAHCFLKICLLEKVTPNRVICVADNPYKDFVGIKSLGFKTIRVRRGNYANIALGKKYEADEEIGNLDELAQIISQLPF